MPQKPYTIYEDYKKDPMTLVDAWLKAWDGKGLGNFNYEDPQMEDLSKRIRAALAEQWEADAKIADKSGLWIGAEPEQPYRLGIRRGRRLASDEIAAAIRAQGGE